MLRMPGLRAADESVHLIGESDGFVPVPDFGIGGGGADPCEAPEGVGIVGGVGFDRLAIESQGTDGFARWVWRAGSVSWR